MQEHRCPECGEEFEVVWGVSIGAHADDYTPVVGGPVVIDYGRCATCHREYERTSAGPWRRRGLSFVIITPRSTGDLLRTVQGVLARLGLFADLLDASVIRRPLISELEVMRATAHGVIVLEYGEDDVSSGLPFYSRFMSPFLWVGPRPYTGKQTRITSIVTQDDWPNELEDALRRAMASS
ncbi:MAG: hypothetical protein QOI42_1025 [Frankiaceae bacterium]|nr:hypothetical protein [Frankiaceae bacterium]